MSIASYSDLTIAVANWLDRDDLTARIPEFISIAESRLNRVVRAPDMLTKDDAFSITGQYVAQPTGFIEAKRIVVLTTPVRVLTFLTPEALSIARQGRTAAGCPTYFSVIGGNLEFLPSPDATYTASFLYYTRLTPVATSWNWLATSHPDIYLYATLVAAEPYIQNDERLVVWKAQLDQFLAELGTLNDRKQVAGTARPHTGGFE